MTVLSFIAASLLGCVHIFAGRIRGLGRVPRAWWLSFAAGTSVAYVFVHLFPEIAARETSLSEGMDEGPIVWLEKRAHLVALAGITLYYTLERLARISRKEQDRQGKREELRHLYTFWLHIGSFALYVATVGYLIRVEPFDADSLTLFTVALALHFLVNDHGLRELHEQKYHDQGRWVLATAPLAGWLLGSFQIIPGHFLSVMVAFLAGGIILNVLKEELPAEREARIIPFVAGVVLYSGLLLAVD